MQPRSLPVYTALIGQTIAITVQAGEFSMRRGGKTVWRVTREEKREDFVLCGKLYSSLEACEMIDNLTVYLQSTKSVGMCRLMVSWCAVSEMCTVNH